MIKYIKKARLRLEYKKANKVVGELLRNRKIVKLNIGCGTDYKKGWINIDNNTDNNIKKLDLNWDLRFPLPFPENSVDFIFHEHFQEHLTVEEGIAVNKDFLRVLKTGGVLRIATPDLEKLVHNYLHVPLDKDPVIKQFKVDFVKTPAEWVNMNFSWWGHKWVYDYEELSRRLRESGFTKISKQKIGKSKHLGLNNIETRVDISLVVEAVK